MSAPPVERGRLAGRARTGMGRAIEVPMFESMVNFVLAEHMNQRRYNDAGAWGDPRIMDPNRRPLRTADGWISISADTDAQSFGFFAAIGRPELKDAARFCSVSARLAHVADHCALRAAVLAQRPTAAWLDLPRVRQVPAMAVNDVGDLFDDPHLQDVGLVETQEHHSEGRVQAARASTLFSEGAAEMADAPLQGEDRRAILEELGYDDAGIAELSAGAVRLA